MDFKEIKELIRIFGKSDLNKLKVREGEFELAMQKGFKGTLVTSTVPIAPIVVPASVISPAVVLGDTVNSPMVGTFYGSPSPESPAFVKEGDTVKKGQTLCILEAMKIMNEIEAEFDCKIIKILVEDGNPVEYDMPMFSVEKL